MDACLNKSTIGGIVMCVVWRSRITLGVPTAWTRPQTSRHKVCFCKYFDDRIKNGNGFNEDSATVEFIKVLRVEEIEEEYEDDDDWAMNDKPTKIMRAKPVSNVDYNDDLDEDLDNIPFYGIDPEDDEDLEDDVHNEQLGHRMYSLDALHSWSRCFC